MPIKFPSSPAEGQIHVISADKKYIHKNGRWSLHLNNLVETEQTSVLLNPIESPTKPPMYIPQKFWLNTVNGALYYKHSVDGVYEWVRQGDLSYDLEGSNVIDASVAEHYTKTITGATTFSIINPPRVGKVSTIVLELKNGGSYVVTWWPGVNWTSGTPPVLTKNGTDILGFYTCDGGVTWRGFEMSIDSKQAS